MDAEIKLPSGENSELSSKLLIQSQNSYSFLLSPNARKSAWYSGQDVKIQLIPSSFPLSS